MKKLVSALLFVCAFGLSQAAPAPAAFAQGISVTRTAMSGEWRGVYFQGPDNQAIEFGALFTERNGRLTGTTIEPNMFGDNSSYWLFATIVGTVQGGEVRFQKTYDGTAGQSHTVSYQGRIINGRRIVGTWSLQGTSGQFEMGR